MAKHQIVIRENTGATKDTAPYLGSYVSKETIREADFAADVVRKCGMSAIQAQAILDGAFEAFEDLEREGLVFTQRSSGRFITEDTAAIGEAKRTLARQHIEQFMASMKKLGYTREEIIALLESGEEEDKNGSML